VFLKTHTSLFSWHGLVRQLALVVAVSFRLFFPGALSLTVLSHYYDADP
jgi:hypothetical protein